MVEYTQEKIAVQNLLAGMYVARLDRPWIGTPFPIQGFHIQDEEDIKTLALYCKHVYVDVVKSRVSVQRTLHALSSPSTSVHPSPTRPRVKLAADEETYTRSRGLKQELHTARRLHRDVVRTVDQLMHKVTNGKPPAIKTARRITVRMVDSIARNPDAFIWITRLRAKDEYSYSHSVRAAVWAVTFGRHLGLARDRLEHLALGVLLSEVGMTRLPERVVKKKAPLTREEHEILKKHVTYGVAMLRESRGIHLEVLEVVAHHHERHNGSGYPRGLKGNQIPLLGRIAGIADFYDALTYPRHEELALSPAEAMIKLHDLRDLDFQAELVDEFIRAIGIYPTGSLIELSTGEVGIITEQNLDRRLRPKVLLILDRDKQPLKKPRELDLFKKERDKSGRLVTIDACLPDGSYDIDLNRYRKRFLNRLLGRTHHLFQ